MYIPVLDLLLTFVCIYLVHYLYISMTYLGVLEHYVVWGWVYLYKKTQNTTKK